VPTLEGGAATATDDVDEANDDRASARDAAAGAVIADDAVVRRWAVTSASRAFPPVLRA
jgi:hypothetical protein